MDKILAAILAGGKGARLYPLTRDRAKPAVPFGGIYRIIDFPLSNCMNAGIRQILILTQYKCVSLDRHIQLGWNLFSRELGEFVEVVPAQQRVGERWYEGTADAIFQNLYSIERLGPKYTLILAGDHIYKMDYRLLAGWHRSAEAALTVCAFEVPRSEGHRFGVIKVDSDMRIVDFLEKPSDPPTIPGRPDTCLASMGIYMFNTDVMARRLRQDSGDESSSHDFGKDIIPRMVAEGEEVYAYSFVDENRDEIPYWRDIGTIEAYWEASMDLLAVDPIFNLYDQDWPMHTYMERCPPAKTVFAQDYEGGRRGVAFDSLVSNGAIISGGRLERCIVSPRVRVNSYSEVFESVLFEGVEVGRYVRIRRAIVDKNVFIEPGVHIGYNPELDAKRFTVSDTGIVVIEKDSHIAFEPDLDRGQALQPPRLREIRDAAARGHMP